MTSKRQLIDLHFLEFSFVTIYFVYSLNPKQIKNLIFFLNIDFLGFFFTHPVYIYIFVSAFTEYLRLLVYILYI